MSETMLTWVRAAVTSWRTRRTDEGGLTDEVAMIAIMVGIAVLVGGALLALLTGAVEGLSFDI